MKKSRIITKLDNILSDEYFKQVYKDNPKVLEELRNLKEYEEDLVHRGLVRLRMKKVNKLRNNIRYESNR